MSDESIEQKKSTGVNDLQATPFASSDQNPGQENQESAGVRSDGPSTMEEAMAELEAASKPDYKGAYAPIRAGQVIDGVVVQISPDSVLVDVGTKSEGIITKDELAKETNIEPNEVVSVGEKIKVFVLKEDSSDGGPLLSKKRADFENAWYKVENAFKDGTILKAMVTDRVKGGLVVDLGIRGFVPGSHIGKGNVKNLDKYIGQSLEFKVIEVDRERRKVVLSNRLVVEQKEEALKAKTLSDIAEGQVREGVVRRLTDYGAFIDLGGVDGLLHVSEMSWTRIKHPSEVVQVGQKVNVKILKLNIDENRVSLGLRQILPDPWEEVKRLYKVGDIIKGEISRIVPFGAFMKVEGGIEGIIPNAEIAKKRVSRPEDVLQVGQEVETKVIDINSEERKLTLSIKQLIIEEEQAKEEKEFQEYKKEQESNSATTIGDLLGAQLGDIANSFTEEPEKEEKTAEPEANTETVEEPKVEEEKVDSGNEEQEQSANEPDCAPVVTEETDEENKE
ncbi:MAG: 30S ribosomal protein S1 [Armatimonadota bacterium]